MAADVVYEIARYGVAEDDEVLFERAQIVRPNGYTAGASVTLGGKSSPMSMSVIRAEPGLDEVRASQVTRVTVVPNSWMSSFPAGVARRPG